jgi:PAS domain S-box-containing protein
MMSTGSSNESEERYRNLINNLTDIVMEIDSDGKFLYVSPQVTEILGYSPKKVIGMKGFEFIHPDDMENSIDALAKVLKDREIVNFEYRSKHKNGHYVPISASAKVIENGDDLKIISIARDITERMKAERSLSESENKYRRLIEGMEDVLVSFSLDGIISYCSPNVISFGGYDPEEEIGEHFTKYIADEEMMSELQEKFKEILSSRKSATFQFIYRPKERDPFYVEATASPIIREGTGDIVSINCVIRNISERKQAEEALHRSEHQFRSTINSIWDAVHVINREFKIQLMNDSFKKWNEELGLEPETLGKNLFEIYPFIGKKVREEYEHIFRTGEPLCTEERNTFDDRVITTETCKFPIVEEDQVISVVTVVKDITERMQTEKALKESNENFQQVVSNITTVVWKADIGNNGAFENTYTSPVVDELLDLPAGTLQNDWDKYFRYVKPEYLERVNNAFREAIISPGKKIDCEYEVLKNNGQTAWFNSIGRCFEKNGKLHVFGSTIDITERKQAEVELQQKIVEFQVIYRATLGREGRVIELKQKVNELLEQLGRKKKFGDTSEKLKVKKGEDHVSKDKVL